MSVQTSQLLYLISQSEPTKCRRDSSDECYATHSSQDTMSHPQQNTAAALKRLMYQGTGRGTGASSWPEGENRTAVNMGFQAVEILHGQGEPWEWQKFRHWRGYDWIQHDLRASGVQRSCSITFLMLQLLFQIHTHTHCNCLYNNEDTKTKENFIFSVIKKWKLQLIVCNKLD